MKLMFPNTAFLNGEVFAEAGEVKEISNVDSANRWIRRGAVPVNAKVVKKAAVKPQENKATPAKAPDVTSDIFDVDVKEVVADQELKVENSTK